MDYFVKRLNEIFLLFAGTQPIKLIRYSNREPGIEKMAASGKKLVKSKSGYRMIPVIESQTSPFTIDEPAWVPDTQVLLSSHHVHR